MESQQVDIPGVGLVEFPDSMTPDEINAAAKRLHDEANVPAPELEGSGGATATATMARGIPAGIRTAARAVANHPAATQKAIGAGISTAAGGVGAGIGGVPGAVVGASIRGVTPTQAAIREAAGRLAGEAPQVARDAGRAVAVANYATEAGLPLKANQVVSTGNAARALDSYAESMGQRVPRILDQYGKVVVGPEAAPVVAKAGPGMLTRAASGLAKILGPLSAATGVTDFAQTVEPDRHDIGVAGIGWSQPNPTAEQAAARGAEAQSRVAAEEQRKAASRTAFLRLLGLAQ